MKKITVVLAEDHLIVREGLRIMLSAEKDIEVVGEAENGREAVKLATALLPAVLVMDIAMPRLNGLEAARQILRSHPSIKIIILSAYSDDAHLESVMALGASGYLVKQTAADVLPRAIRSAVKGERLFSPVISERLVQKKRAQVQKGTISKADPAAKSTVKLTSRETEVLQLIAEGNANKQAADILNISIKTIEKHRQNVMQKLHIHHTAGLTLYAINSGMIESSVQSTKY